MLSKVLFGAVSSGDTAAVVVLGKYGKKKRKALTGTTNTTVTTTTVCHLFNALDNLAFDCARVARAKALADNAAAALFFISHLLPFLKKQKAARASLPTRCPLGGASLSTTSMMPPPQARCELPRTPLGRSSQNASSRTFVNGVH